VVVALEVDVGLLAVHTVVGTAAIEAVDSLRTKVRSDWWLVDDESRDWKSVR